MSNRSLYVQVYAAIIEFDGSEYIGSFECDGCYCYFTGESHAQGVLFLTHVDSSEFRAHLEAQEAITIKWAEGAK